jgi:hypothetical protein
MVSGKLIKRKIKLSLCLIKHSAMKMYGGSEGTAPAYLTSALDGGEWSASHSCCFTPRENVPGTHWVGGWVGPRTSLDAVEKRKILQFWESNPRCPAHSPLLYRLSYPNFYSKLILEDFLWCNKCMDYITWVRYKLITFRSDDGICCWTVISALCRYRE